MTDTAVFGDVARPAILRRADGVSEEFASLDEAMEAWRDLSATQQAGAVIEVAGEDWALSEP